MNHLIEHVVMQKGYWRYDCLNIQLKKGDLTELVECRNILQKNMMNIISTSERVLRILAKSHHQQESQGNELSPLHKPWKELHIVQKSFNVHWLFSALCFQFYKTIQILCETSSTEAPKKWGGQ